MSNLAGSATQPFQRDHRVVVGLFFVAFLLVGPTIFEHYGVAYDEVWHMMLGKKSVEHAFKLLTGTGSESEYMRTGHARSHGPVYQMFLYGLQKALHLGDTRSVLLMRHLVTHLVFLTAAYCFYLLCQRRFNNWKLSLLGSALLLLHPRIFAHSFYNSADISFLSAFIVSIYAMIRYLESTTLSRSIFLAVSCAILVTIRVVGVFVPLLAILFITRDAWRAHAAGKSVQPVLNPALVFIATCTTLSFLLWPYLWTNPAKLFVKAAATNVDVGLNARMLYLGHAIQSRSVPWHYNFVWIAVTTPLLYLVLFAAGFLATAYHFILNPMKFLAQRTFDSIMLGWLIVPLVAPVVFGSTLYDDWRHHYFVYPALIVFALMGIEWWFNFARARFRPKVQRGLSAAFAVIICACLMNVVYRIVQLHPFEAVYFNRLAGPNMTTAQEKFDFEYWGLAYRNALEHILLNDPEAVITITGDRHRIDLNGLILPPRERKRLVYAENPADAKYRVLGNRFPLQKNDGPGNQWYSVNIGGAEAVAVYRVPADPTSKRGF
jgi:hypothetical protein